MKTKSTLTLFLLLFCSVAFACYNEYQTKLTKQMIWIANNKLHFQNDYYTKQQLRDNIMYPGGPKSNFLYEYKSDSAVTLCYLGKYEDALKAFLQIEKDKPGMYATAANIGTTYELLGKNDSALKWIKKSIEINSNSHGGSEWIHVKILEAKIKAGNNKNKDFLAGYNVLDLDWGNGALPIGATKDYVDLRNDILFQLNERLKFIKPKDDIMARLLFDLGTVCAFTNDFEMALTAYAKAEEFGYNTEQFKRWKNTFANMDPEAKMDVNGQDKDRSGLRGFTSMEFKRHTPAWVWQAASGVVVLLMVTMFFVTRRRAVNKK